MSFASSASFIPFKDFMKCLKKGQKIFAYGWIRSDIQNKFDLYEAPAYYYELPVEYFHFDKDGTLNIRFAFSDEAFNNA